ncbi:MAG: peptidylprolyl isomerase [Dehalococcoidia bacterium]|nr:peptidylprolyl isomerase [Dehalococcoidia bacterium]
MSTKKPGKASPSPQPPVSRGQAGRWRKQQKLQRTTVIAGVVAILLILAIPVYGYLETVVFPFNETIVKVNDKVFTMNDYVRTLRLFKTGSDISGQQLNLGIVPFEVLQILEDNEILRQAAPRVGLQVTDQEIDQELRKRVLPQDAKAQPSPVELEREFKEGYAQRLSLLKLSDAEYRDVVRADLLREKVRDMLGVQLPTVTRQARLDMVLTSNERLSQVQTELQKGTDFKLISKQLSTDPDLQDSEGDYGWTPVGVTPEMDDDVFGLQPGNISAPIEAKDGFYILKTVERTGDRVHILAMKVADKDKAQDALSKYRQASEDFAVAFNEFNADPDLKAKNGDLGFVEKGYQGGLFDEALFGLPIGKISDPMGAAQGIYFIRVVERAEARRIDDKRRDVLKTKALEKWLQDERKNNKVERFFNDRRYSWAVDQITKELRSSPPPQPRQGQGSQ